jgi:two-component system invasion response regulator UvrY
VTSTKHLLIVDAHEITRQGYISVLRSRRNDLEFGEAGSFPEALQLVTARTWDLIILELCMPGRSGLELLDQLASVGSDSPVLVSTIHDEESYGIRAIRRGVSGYFCKAAGVQEFVNAVEILLDGKKYLSASLIQSLMGAMHPSVAERPHEELSDREFQVLQRLAAGVAIKHMAQEMCLSPKTVSTYRTRIMKKLGVISLVGLVEYCLENRLTTKQAVEEKVILNNKPSHNG